MTSFDDLSGGKPGDRSSRATIRPPSSTFDDEDNNDAESHFSYVQSFSNDADFSYKPPTANPSNIDPAVAAGASDSGVTGTHPSKPPQVTPPSTENTSSTDSSSVQSKKTTKSSSSAAKSLFDEIRSNLDNLNLNIAGFSTGSRGSTHNKRESFNSSFSQYSGTVESTEEVEPVSVIQVNPQEFINESDENGLSRGVSLTRVTNNPPQQQQQHQQQHQPAVETAHSETHGQPSEPSESHNQYYSPQSEIRYGVDDVTPRLPSEASMPVGKLETIAATPTSQYSDASEGTGSTDHPSPQQAPQGSRIRPNISTNTNIESTIPPRSSMRPKSGAFDDNSSNEDLTGTSTPTSLRKKKHNKKRSSLSVTDGLDELMRNANQMKLQQPKGSAVSVTDSIDSGNFKTPIETSSQEKLYSEVSHDMYMTADDGSSSGASTEFLPSANNTIPYESKPQSFGQEQLSATSPSKKNAPLPPRPTADNIRRAREVSQQISLKELEQQQADTFGNKTPKVPSEEDIGIDRSATLIIPQNKQEDTNVTPTEREVDARKVSPSDNLLSGLITGGVVGGVAAAAAAAVTSNAKAPLNREKSLPLAPIATSAETGTASPTPPSAQAAPVLENSTSPFQDPSKHIESPPYPMIEKISSENVTHPIKANANTIGITHLNAVDSSPEFIEQHEFENQDAYGNAPPQSRPNNALTTPSHGPRLPPQGLNRAGQDNATISTTTTPSIAPGALNSLDQDDEYYDIEPVTKPARAKSVKQSIINTAAPAGTSSQEHRHKRKSKSKGGKKSRATSSALKPFSYQTLISLLESTNGTVIGEEFSQLDLPAKEKQLIEKIIDALSRLSADMVLDRDRYEIGIRRLESALRVLEGFM